MRRGWGRERVYVRSRPHARTGAEPEATFGGGPHALSSGPCRRRRPPTLTCPLCAGTSFQTAEERTDGRWGLTTHVKLLLICDRCRYVLTFYDTNSIFDFD